MRLLELLALRDAELGRPAAVSIVGTAKNVGKTTALNWLVERLAPQGPLGLTSVGRDGEDLDAVTDLPKPRIRPPVGTLLATAEASARRATAPLSLVRKTDLHTGLGAVGIYRVTGAGAVELAGPVSVDGARSALEALHAAGAGRVLVDGAIDRRASASPRLADTVLLATGLAMAASGGARLAPLPPSHGNVTKAAPEPTQKDLLERTVLESVSIVNTLTSQHSNIVDKIDASGYVDVNGQIVAFPSGQVLEDPEAFVSHLPQALKAIVLTGALSEGLARALLARKLPRAPIIVPDATHAVCRPNTLDRLVARGHPLEVIRTLNLLAVTANPTAPHAPSLDALELLKALRRALPSPVFDLVAQP